MKHFIVLIFAVATVFAQVKDKKPVGPPSSHLAAHGEPESSTAIRDRSTALEPKTDRQPVPAQPASSTDPRQ